MKKKPGRQMAGESESTSRKKVDYKEQETTPSRRSRKVYRGANGAMQVAVRVTLRVALRVAL